MDDCFEVQILNDTPNIWDWIANSLENDDQHGVCIARSGEKEW